MLAFRRHRLLRQEEDSGAGWSRVRASVVGGSSLAGTCAGHMVYLVAERDEGGCRKGRSPPAALALEFACIRMLGCSHGVVAGDTRMGQGLPSSPAAADVVASVDCRSPSSRWTCALDPRRPPWQHMRRARDGWELAVGLSESPALVLRVSSSLRVVDGESPGTPTRRR